MISQLLGNRYLIKEQIGRGGMAAIYLAYDESLKRKVAVKVLHQQFASNAEIRERLRLEARSISQLDHPNIIKVYDFSGDTEKLWIVTEILDGINLDQFVKNYVGRKLHPIVATLIASEICKALEHAHNFGIIHRDVKPKNVMILRTGQIKLMDFGIAKDVHGSKTTLTGVFIGSPSYMSPEQIDPTKNIDSRSDIYSLCVMFYEIVTGSLPFISSHTVKLAKKIMSGQFIPPKEKNPCLPNEVNKLICKGLQSDLDERFANITELKDSLAQFLSQNKFMESHIELERYFKNPQNFNTRLLRFDDRLKNPAISESSKPSKFDYINGISIPPKSIQVKESKSFEFDESERFQNRPIERKPHHSTPNETAPTVELDDQLQQMCNANLSEQSIPISSFSQKKPGSNEQILKNIQDKPVANQFSEELTTTKIKISGKNRNDLSKCNQLDSLIQYKDIKESLISVSKADQFLESIKPPVICSNVSVTDTEMTIEPKTTGFLKKGKTNLNNSEFSSSQHSSSHLERKKPKQEYRSNRSHKLDPNNLNDKAIHKIKKKIRYQKMVNSIEKIVTQQMMEEKYSRKNSWKEYIYGVLVTGAIIGFSIWGYKGFERKFDHLLNSSKIYFSKIKKLDKKSPN